MILSSHRGPICNYCGQINNDSCCCVCYLIHRGQRTQALLLARDLNFEVGPFCRFCEDDSDTVLCDWPGWKTVEKPIEKADVGDLWITEKAAKRARIVEIENLDYHGVKTKTNQSKFLQRMLWVQISGHPKPYPYLRYVGDTFTTEALAICDQSACWRHSREVDEDRHYCADHWRAWESVA